MTGLLKAANLPSDSTVSYQLHRGHGNLARAVSDEGYGVGTAFWYAATILEDIAHLRASVAKGSRDQIMHDALHLGALLMEANIVISHGQAFETGMKQYANLAEMRARWNASQTAKASERHQAWVDQAKAIWSRSPRLTVSACASGVIGKLQPGAAKKTVADAIRPFKPQKLGGAR
jgi:hypothetical protein